MIKLDQSVCQGCKEVYYIDIQKLNVRPTHSVYLNINGPKLNHAKRL